MTKSIPLKNIYSYAQSLGINRRILNYVLMKELRASKKDLFFIDIISGIEYNKIKDALKRIASGFPVEYIYNRAEFYGREFYINNDVLIPRDDTELIIDVYRKKFSNGNTLHIDVGTGSGIIPITLQLENITNNSIALDISNKAIYVAQNNVQRYDLSSSIQLARSYLLLSKSIKLFLKSAKEYNARDIVITSNLPYIKNNDSTLLESNVKKYEPSIALFGGEMTGFELYESMLMQIAGIQKDFQNLRFHAIIEIGANQFEISKTFLKNNGFQFEYFKDTSTIYRTIYITKFLGA